MKAYQQQIETIARDLAKLVAGTVLATCLYSANSAECKSGLVLTVNPAKRDAAIVQDSYATSVTEAVRSLQEDKTDQKARQVLKAVANSHSENAGYAMLRLGYLDRKAGLLTGCKEKWEQIVNEQVPASPEVRAEAYYRSGLIHVRLGDYRTASQRFASLMNGTVACSHEIALESAKHLAFSHQHVHRASDAQTVWQEIIDKSPNLDGQAYAMLQSSGLYWETGKGDHGPVTDDEARHLFRQSQERALQLLTNYPDAPSLTRATAHLLYLEQYHFLKQYEAVPALVDRHLELYPEHKIQVTTALVWKLIALHRMGRHRECMTTCDILLTGGYTNKDHYRNLDIFQYAHIYKSLAADALGLTEVARIERNAAAARNSSLFNNLYPQLSAKSKGELK